MEKLKIFDETLDSNLTSNYSISIRLSSDGFCFSILDLIRNKYIGLKKIAFESTLASKYYEQLKEALDKEEFLDKNYKKVNIIITDSRSTLIPISLFDENLIKKVVDLNFSTEETEMLYYNKIQSLNSYLAFPVMDHISTLLFNKFKNAKIFHNGYPFIESVLISNKNKPAQNKLFLDINKKFIDVAIFKNSRFELYNSFEYKTNEDMVYFILNLMEQFQLNPEKDEVELKGLIGKGDEMMIMLKKYIKNIKIEKPTDHISCSYKFNEIQSQHFSNLLNILHCE